MKKLLLTSLLFALFSGISYAKNVDVQNSIEQNISPVLCQMNYSDKYPSCTISFYAEKGTKIETSFHQQKQVSSYVEDDVNTNTPMYENNSAFISNPLVAVYNTSGTKKIRLIYTQPISNDVASQELYGRFHIKVFNNNKEIVQNLPVYFMTAPKQSFKISSMKLGSLDIHYTDSKGKVVEQTLPTLVIRNDGNGVFATGMISFNIKQDPTKYNLNDSNIDTGFTTLNINILPHSTGTVIIFNKQLANKLKASVGKTLVFLDKQTMGYDNITLNWWSFDEEENTSITYRRVVSNI